MRILVTGSRYWTDAELIGNVLAWFDQLKGGEEMVLVHGAARGADRIAAEIARDLGWTVEPHPADWGKYGVSAGPARNAKMVALGAEVCLAFVMPNSVGTWDCVRRAEDAAIPTRVFDIDAAEVDW